MAAVIETRGLTKHFGTVTALDGLDLVVQPGEVHGFLGPNGSGKSTTLRVLLGLVRRDGGQAQVFGEDPWQRATDLHRRLAYVPGDVTLWPNLTGGEIIDLLFRLRGKRHESRRSELLERFELDPTKKGRAYSKGNRQKVALVAALASDAELLLLDEPTAGLDPLMERVFQDELVRVRDEGRTVVLSSHILSEVEKACSRVSIVRDGKVVESGDLRELQHLRRTHLTATLAQPPSAEQLGQIDGFHDAGITTDPRGTIVSGTAEPDEVGRVISALQPFGIRSLLCAPPTLEELFLARYTQP